MKQLRNLWIKFFEITLIFLTMAYLLFGMWALNFPHPPLHKNYGNSQKFPEAMTFYWYIQLRLNVSLLNCKVLYCTLFKKLGSRMQDSLIFSDFLHTQLKFSMRQGEFATSMVPPILFSQDIVNVIISMNILGYFRLLILKVCSSSM